MHSKILTILLLLAAMGTVGFVTEGGKSEIRRKSYDPHKAFVNAPQQDSSNAIDGSKNPELIPDNVAWALLFRLISNRQTDIEKNRIRAFIRQMGIGKPCCGRDQSFGTGEADIDALIAVADEFQQKVGVLDVQAKEIKGRNPSNQSEETKGQLKKLQKQKEKIIEDLVAALLHRLSDRGVKKMHKYISEQVKRSVKLSTTSNS